MIKINNILLLSFALPEINFFVMECQIEIILPDTKLCSRVSSVPLMTINFLFVCFPPKLTDLLPKLKPLLHADLS